MIQLEKEVLLFLTEWSYHVQRVRKLEEMLATAKVNMTVEYRESASSGRSGSSMVEELVMKKARIENLRLYVSADNLFTFSKFFYAYDPETPVSKGGYYPLVKTVVFGVNLSFK